MTNYEVLLSGAIGIIIGTIIGGILDYRIRISLIKKEFEFKEKANNYDKILSKINQIYDWHQRGLISKDPEEITRRVHSHKETLEYFIRLDPPNFNYSSSKIKEHLKKYYNFLKEASTKEKYSKEEILEITKKIDNFTNLLRKQIKKELK